MNQDISTERSVNNTLKVKRKRSEGEGYYSEKDFFLLMKTSSCLNDKTYFAVSGLTTSSKPYVKDGGDDRCDLARPFEYGVTKDKKSFYSAVFDGHGGSQVSEFLKAELKKRIFMNMKNTNELDVEQNLSNAFVETDIALYERILKAREEINDPKKEKCRCRFYLENPCRCYSGAIEARQGSTATVVLLENGFLNIANVGDSDSYLFSYDSLIRYNESLKAKKLEESRTTPMYRELSNLNSIRKDRNPLQAIDIGTSQRIEYLKKHVFSNFVREYQCSRIQNESDIKPDITKLTESHTPKTAEECEEYQRIKSIAKIRAENFNSIREKEKIGDGIKRGCDGRFNYVRFPGTHSLNMTRAFGNFGHKVYEASERNSMALNQALSPVLVAPATKRIDLSDFNYNCFVIVATDGLWDNLEKEEVYEIVIETVRKCLPSTWKKVRKSPAHRNKNLEKQAEIVLALLAMKVCSTLVSKAHSAKKKLDDITVVTILFNSILTVFA